MTLLVINGRRVPWSCEGSMPQCRVMPGPRSGSGWVGEQGEGREDRGFSEGKPGKGDNIWNVNKENIHFFFKESCFCTQWVSFRTAWAIQKNSVSKSRWGWGGVGWGWVGCFFLNLPGTKMVILLYIKKWNRSRMLKQWLMAVHIGGRSYSLSSGNVPWSKWLSFHGLNCIFIAPFLSDWKDTTYVLGLYHQCEYIMCSIYFVWSFGSAAVLSLKSTSHLLLLFHWRNSHTLVHPFFCPTYICQVCSPNPLL